jgi:site-specific recombinase XerD
LAGWPARRAHIELWQRGLEQHGYALRTIALKLTAVASFYRYCEQEELVVRTPMACVRRPRVERLSPRGALSRGQVHDLLAAAQRLGPHPYGLCCVLALNGLRIGEATGLDVDDLDYDGLFPILRFTRKGARAGVAVLARPTEAAITACIAERTSGPLFLNRAGQRMDQRGAQRILDRAVANLRGRHPRVTPHVLRHSWTTLAIDAGVPHDQIQHDGGWSDARMVSYYTHGRDQALRATTHSVAAYVLSAPPDLTSRATRVETHTVQRVAQRAPGNRAVTISGSPDDDVGHAAA